MNIQQYTNQEKQGNLYPLDLQFQRMMQEIGAQPEEQIRLRLNLLYKALPDRIQKILEDYFKKYGFWGTLNIFAGDDGVLANRAKALHDHYEDFLWLYQRLADYRSRLVLFAFVNNWYSFDTETLRVVKETLYKSYFDMDIMKCSQSEVMVDLGAYTGDTVKDYISVYGLNYKRFYCYEISPHTMNMLQENLKGYENIIYCQKGASDHPGLMYIQEHAADISANVLTDQGSISVEAVTIDQDIQEPVTLIKMDIEGSEQQALRGAAAKIKESKPKLALSLYHNNEDVWKIPRMVEEICPGYTFYLRYHGENLSPTELTLLAVWENPEEKA